MFIHFVSLNEEWVKEIRKQFANCSVKITEADIRTIPIENTIFVSPANCIGYMDSGMDLTFNRYIFPRIETSVMEKIKNLQNRLFLGRPYLPVGDAILTPYAPSALISAPTMVLPRSNSMNAYHSFLAALRLFHKYRRNHPTFQTLIVTSHCCGNGNMSAEDSAKQMKQAYDDFLKNAYPDDKNEDDTILLLPILKEDSEEPNKHGVQSDEHIVYL